MHFKSRERWMVMIEYAFWCLGLAVPLYFSKKAWNKTSERFLHNFYDNPLPVCIFILLYWTTVNWWKKPAPRSLFVYFIWVHVCRRVCVCVSVRDWSADLEANPGRQGWHLLHERGGCAASVSYTLMNTRARRKPRANATHINGAHSCIRRTHTAHKLHCLRLFRCPPWAFPVHLWRQNDHSAPRNPSSAVRNHTHTGTPWRELDGSLPLPRRKKAARILFV